MTGIVCSMVGATFGVAAAATIVRAKKGIIANGNAQISTAQSKFGGASLYNDGTGDYIEVVNSNSFSLGTGNFTIELWWRATSRVGSYPPIITNFNDSYSADEWGLFDRHNSYSTKFMFDCYNILNTGPILISTTSVSNATWYHLAIVRNGTTFTLYVNGISEATYTSSASVDSGNYKNLFLGAVNGNYSNGHTDEIRISKTARYTTTFTPSTTPFTNDDDTLLLMHMNGTNASTFFEDDNGTGRSANGIYANGNAQISTAQSKFGGTSALFDGTGDYLIVANDNLLYWNTQPYTIEYWCRISALTSQANDDPTIVGNLNSGGQQDYWSFGPDNSGNLTFKYYNSASVTVKDTGTMSTGIWYHCAAVITSNTIKIYLDGVEKASAAISGTPQFSTGYGGLNIGWGYSSQGYNGYLDELRISNTARYTANFTPQAMPFTSDSNTLLLMHMDGTNTSTVFRDDNGATASTSTGTAVAFDGSGDYYTDTGLSTSATDNKYAVVAINFYYNAEIPWSGTNLMHLVNLYLPGGNGFYTWVNGGRMQFIGGQLNIYENTENSLTPYAWNQVVFFIDATSQSNCRIYVNGQSKAFSNDGFSNANFNWGATGAVIKIGQLNTNLQSAGVDMNGKISQVYISNASSFPGIEYFWNQGPRDLGTNGTKTGLAQPLIYHYGDNSTFTTNNGTGFASYTLTANGNAGSATSNLPTFYSPRSQKGIQSIGNAQVSTTQSKFGGTSAYFDGTGDGLYVTSSSPMVLGTGDFTIEGWVYFSSTAISVLVDALDRTQFPLVYWSGSAWIYYHQTIGAAISGGSASTNTWYHWAVVRASGSTKFYVNGTQVGSTYSDSINWTGTNNAIYGINGNLSQQPLTGYMDELRISNTARYTTTFTPSTTPFTNDANTLLLIHCDGTNGSTTFVDDNGIADHTA